MSATLKFTSTVSVFLTYLILKAAPISAVVYYFSNWQYALLSGIVLLIVILLYSGLTNNHFSLTPTHLIVHPSLFFWKKDLEIPYSEIHSIQIKYAVSKDNRQWLAIRKTAREKPQIYRCDWLHQQDPPEEDEDDHEHGSASHELFQLLEDEDFYDGSLEHLANVLRSQSVLVTERG